jgi:hypothetical protein
MLLSGLLDMDMLLLSGLVKRVVVMAVSYWVSLSSSPLLLLLDTSVTTILHLLSTS